MTSNDDRDWRTRQFGEQTHRQQAYPQHGYQDHGYPNRGYQGQGYQETRYQDQAHQDQAYGQTSWVEQQQATPEHKEPPTPPAPPAQRVWPWVLLAVAAFVIGAVLGAAGMSSSKKSASNTQTVTVQAQPTTETQTTTITASTTTTTSSGTSSSATSSAASGPRTSFGDGTWMVGSGIEPGTYSTDGGDGCYWARLGGLSGATDDILANDNASGPATVTISGTDAAFQSQDCGTWTLIR
ncbi:hypothetical protein [Jongsikchunia kroppenstedtii]|uniref:hypothetical protein n=1 Tax=Jongsikchunia kroppenstedtii TaxID=1121721 RepID=UPI000381777A|nr:hypothetical protein [Jongsikchunia kroppenstedtii]